MVNECFLKGCIVSPARRFSECCFVRTDNEKNGRKSVQSKVKDVISHVMREKG